MRALVTGGGGFLGRYIVEQLQARGDEVRIFSRGAYPELAASGITVCQGDLSDRRALSEAVAGVDAVFHVAAIPGIWGPADRYLRINTKGTLNVIAACREHGVERLIYTSSPSVVYDGKSHLNADESLPYPTQYLCHYPHSKALAERAVLEEHEKGGLKTVALRPHLIWGPRDNHLIPRLVQRALSGRLRRVGDGSNLISMSYVENTARAHLQAHDELLTGGKCAGKAYFINEPSPVQLWDWINDILALGGVPPVKKSISAGLAKRVGGMLEVAYSVLGRTSEPPMTRFLASQLSQSHTYSIENARRDFGYQPLFTIEEGMQRLTPLVQTLVDGRR